jgi:FkbM family methyltransferase
MGIMAYLYMDCRAQLAAAKKDRLSDEIADKQTNLRYSSYKKQEANAEVSAEETAGACKAMNLDLDTIFRGKKKLWLQVGTFKNPMTPGKNSDIAVVAFDAQTKIVKANQENYPGVYHINAAVSNYNGLATFNTFDPEHDASFTLNDISPARKDQIEGAWGQIRKTVVPVLSMKTVLPCLLAGPIKQVDFFMCDAEGTDLAIMKGVGPMLFKYVRKIRMELETLQNKDEVVSGLHIGLELVPFCLLPYGISRKRRARSTTPETRTTWMTRSYTWSPSGSRR